MYERIGPLELMILLLLPTIFAVVCFWRIWTKAGYNGAWSLLQLVPLANLISPAYLAFAKWPSLSKDNINKTFD